MSIQITYKGSTIASFANTTKTLKTSGKYMEGDVAVTETTPMGTATTPAKTITTNPTVTLVSSTAKITASYSGSSSITPTIVSGYISAGTAGTISTTGTSTITLTSQAAQTINTSTADQTIASYRWLTGTQTIKSVTIANITAANIKSGIVVKIGDANNASRITQVTGTYLAPTYMQSLTCRSKIASTATDFQAYISTLATVNSGQFAGQPLSGAFTFSAATTIGPLAFAAGNAGYTYTNAYTLSFPVATTIGSGAFYQNVKITNVTAPSVTTISAYAFSRCIGITSVNFPLITAVTTGAFRECTALSSADFPVVTTIGSSAFTYCSVLKTLRFPSATTIYNYAFSRCNNLNAFYFRYVTSINSHAFNFCSNLRTAWLYSVADISAYAFSSCYTLMNLMITSPSIPTLANANAFATTPISTYTTSTNGFKGSIFVPSTMLASYKAAANWAAYSAKIVGYWGNAFKSSYFTTTSTINGLTFTVSSTNRRVTIDGTATADTTFEFYHPDGDTDKYFNDNYDYLLYCWPASLPSSYGYAGVCLADFDYEDYCLYTTSGYDECFGAGTSISSYWHPGEVTMVRIDHKTRHGSGHWIEYGANETGFKYPHGYFITINSGVTISNAVINMQLFYLTS